MLAYAVALLKLASFRSATLELEGAMTAAAAEGGREAARLVGRTEQRVSREESWVRRPRGDGPLLTTPSHLSIQGLT